jgi:hypothetical protein
MILLGCWIGDSRAGNDRRLMDGIAHRRNVIVHRRNMVPMSSSFADHKAQRSVRQKSMQLT